MKINITENHVAGKHQLRPSFTCPLCREALVAKLIDGAYYVGAGHYAHVGRWEAATRSFITLEGTTVHREPVHLDGGTFFHVKELHVMTHGSAPMYSAGCRCDLCKAVNSGQYKQAKERRKIRYVHPATLQLYETPLDLAIRMVNLAGLKADMRVLEPSAGRGAIVSSIMHTQPSEVVAIELAEEHMETLRTKAHTSHRMNFMDASPETLGLFDAVVMNPPFGQRADIKHILHATQFLKPAGRLVSLCRQGYLRNIKLRPLAKEWIDLPDDTFKDTRGLVRASLMVYEKN